MELLLADRARAKADGRTNLGGDIMIHGKAATIGCVPVGDDAIEDIFYLASERQVQLGTGHAEPP